MRFRPHNTDVGRKGNLSPDAGTTDIKDVRGTKVYVAGDTEDIPEMQDLKDIDILFCL